MSYYQFFLLLFARFAIFLLYFIPPGSVFKYVEPNAELGPHNNVPVCGSETLIWTEVNPWFQAPLIEDQLLFVGLLISGGRVCCSNCLVVRVVSFCVSDPYRKIVFTSQCIFIRCTVFGINY